MKRMEIPAPTNTISSKENGSKYDLSPEAPVPAGFLTLYTKGTKTTDKFTIPSLRLMYNVFSVGAHRRIRS